MSPQEGEQGIDVALFRALKALEEIEGSNEDHAGLLLTTEVMIVEAPKNDEHAHGGAAPGGMRGPDMQGA
ncbi:MAG: hypothetical protein WDO72_13470 [Pseudomonadota bacterium]